VTAEIWKPIAGYEGRYNISTRGHVQSLYGVQPRLLTPRRFKGGLAVTLSRDDMPTGFLLHRLVLMTFEPLPDGPLRSFHIRFADDDVYNCRLDNLSWVPFAGEGSASSKLTQSQVDEIRGLWVSDPQITQRAIARRFGMSDSAISAIVSGKTWVTAETKAVQEVACE
jgi:predicted XRE-type DNA-binding protein